MKKIFTYALALAASLAVNAQNITTDGWVEGQDVTDLFSWGDINGAFSGTNDTGDNAEKVLDNGTFWKGTKFTEVATYNDLTVYGFYNERELDSYQVIFMPAGTYTISVQALYREGTPYNTVQTYNAGTSKKNAWLYADLLSSEDATSTVTRSFDKAIMSLANNNQTEPMLDSYGQGQDWKNDEKFVKNDGITYYLPKSNEGLTNFFNKGEYWNDLKIVLLEDSYVRVGVRKTGYISEDWVPTGQWSIKYEGAPNPADLAALEIETALDELNNIQFLIEATGFDAIVAAIEDFKMENDYYDAFGAGDIEALDAILATVRKAIDDYTNTYRFVQNLADLFAMTEDMLASTEFPGYEAFEAVYTDKRNAAYTSEDGTPEFYEGIYNEVAKARADYLDSQEADETGAKDFSSLIKHPWFVNPEYTPTKNEDGTWTLSEETWNWSDVQGQDNYNNKKNGRTDICSKVTIAQDDDVLNQWFFKKEVTSGWSAGLNLFYQGGLIGVSQGWTDGFDGYEGVMQQLVGLPNGYYSLRALMRGNGASGANTWNDDNMPPYHNIVARNSAGEEVKSAVGHTDSYYCKQRLAADNGWYEWNPVIWTEHKTGTIQVNDGRLLIGGMSSMVMNLTGFRLMFYGTNPPFDAMITDELNEVQPLIDALQFAGDKKYVNDLKAQIVLPLGSAANYDVALNVVGEIRTYCGLAAGGQNKFNAAETLAGLAEGASEEEVAILAPVTAMVAAFGESEADVYTQVEDINSLAKKYGEYLDVYKQAVAFNDEGLTAKANAQAEELKAAAQTVEVIDGYLASLRTPFNIALFNQLGAGAATAAAPADVTSVIVNPTFEKENGDNDPTTGWSGETPTVNEYGRGNAELWNKGSFTLSQTLASLPAGTYELSVKAIYRDVAGSIKKADFDAYMATGGTTEAWTNHRAQLFAKTSDENDVADYIKAVYDCRDTENSFRKVATAFEDETQDDGSVIKVPSAGQTLDEEDDIYSPVTEGSYPFDRKVDMEDGSFVYFPESMYGFYSWCEKAPEVVTSKVVITIPEGGADLVIGIRKDGSASGDWVIFDDFKLTYLSGDVFQGVLTDIQEIKGAAADAQFVNSAAQPVDGSYKGFVFNKNVKLYQK